MKRYVEMVEHFAYMGSVMSRDGDVYLGCEVQNC